MDLRVAAGLRQPEKFVNFISIGVIVIAIAALVGCWVGSVTLRSVVPGAIALQPTTAVALIVGAFGLLAGSGGHRWAARLAGVVLLVPCLGWLSAYVSPHALSVDLLLFRKAVLAQDPSPVWPGRPSIITCVVIALFAASLLGVGWRQPKASLAAVGAASTGGLIASLSILPFLLQDPSEISILHQSLRIALNTSVGVGALCAGVLILKRDTGWVRLVAGGGARGRIARLLTPVAFGTVANIGVREGLYGPDVRMLLIIVLSSVALLFLAFWAAQMLGRERAASDSLANALERSKVIVVDEDNRIERWSKACEAFYGWTAFEVLGRRPKDFLVVDGDENLGAVRSSMRSLGEWRGEVLHRTKAGEERWVVVELARQDPSPDGRLRTVGAITDITDLKLAEASLRESEARLTLAVTAYNLGICDIDIPANTMIADEGLERIFGVQPGAMNGSMSARLDGPLNDSQIEARRRADEATAAHLPSLVDDLRIDGPEGEPRALHGVRRFFYSAEGAHVRTIGIYRDVTDERRADRELVERDSHLAQLRSELAHVSRLSAMGEMAAALAHELNQPLTAVGNSVGALKIMLADGARSLDDIGRKRVIRAADQAEGQAVRAGEIVRRLRDFIARGEADARIEMLGPLIVDALALGAPNARGDQIEIKLNLSPNAERVLADRIQIQQILVNLIRNATEAMQGSPVPRILTIAASAKDGMVEVSVRNTGPGVAPDFAKQLFSPFLSTKRTGMGVGLSICRRIVEAHGGQMWLEDTPGPGADFRFTVPLVA